MNDVPKIRFAAIGLDHRHIYEQVGRLIELGSLCVGYWTAGTPQPLEGFVKRFPDIPRVEDRARLLEDETISLIVTAGVPHERAKLAIEAMRHGKDVMVDKPGCTSLAALEILRKTQRETGRIWSVNFSERFEVSSVAKARAIVRSGQIGRVVQTLGLGPHRLNKHLRPTWFFDPGLYGGTLTDIASHQIDQFLFLTGSNDAEIVHSAVGNFANPEHPEFEDFGEVVLQNDQARGYVRVDWYTADGLSTWGDGRLVVLGTDGTIELRKYVDIAGRDGGNHLFLVTNQTTEHIDCSDAGLDYYTNLLRDIRDRTETAMTQEHAFKVMELAIEAQMRATRLGHLA